MKELLEASGREDLVRSFERARSVYIRRGFPLETLGTNEQSDCQLFGSLAPYVLEEESSGLPPPVLDWTRWGLKPVHGRAAEKAVLSLHPTASMSLSGFDDPPEAVLSVHVPGLVPESGGPTLRLVSSLVSDALKPLPPPPVAFSVELSPKPFPDWIETGRKRKEALLSELSLFADARKSWFNQLFTARSTTSYTNGTFRKAVETHLKRCPICHELYAAAVAGGLADFCSVSTSAIRMLSDGLLKWYRRRYFPRMRRECEKAVRERGVGKYWMKTTPPNPFDISDLRRRFALLGREELSKCSKRVMKELNGREGGMLVYALKATPELKATGLQEGLHALLKPLLAPLAGMAPVSSIAEKGKDVLRTGVRGERRRKGWRKRLNKEARG